MAEAWKDPAVELPAPGSYVEFVGTKFSYVVRGVFDRGLFCGRWHDTPPEMVSRWRPISADQITDLDF